MEMTSRTTKVPVLFSGRSRGALLHYLDHREEGKVVAICKAKIITKPILYSATKHELTCERCMSTWAELGCE